MIFYRTALVPAVVFALAAIVLPSLSGCASSNGAGGRTKDLHTQSDDTEVRKRARIRLELATTYYAQGQFSTALDELKQAIAIDPSLPAVHELRGLIYDAMGEKSMAEASFKRALNLNERDGSVLHNYAWFLCRQGQYAAADALFERALALPQAVASNKTLLVRGVCQVNAGLFPEAEKTLLKSYELDPSNPATAYNLAAVLYRRGELERARFYIRRVNGVQTQVSAASLWLAIRIENRMGNASGRDDLAEQLRTRFVGSAEANALELGRFDE